MRPAAALFLCFFWLGAGQARAATDRPDAALPLPEWWPEAPSLPVLAGESIRVGSAWALVEAAENAKAGTTILVDDGEYQLPRPIVLDRKEQLTIRGARGDPARVILRGQGWVQGSDRDDLVHIARCDGVRIADLTLADCRSYGIKVEAEHAPRNVLIYHCNFRDIGVRALKGSAGRDPQMSAVGGSVRYCRFENTRLPPADWLFGGDYIGAIDMMALEDWTFSDNLFRNVRGRNGGGRAAIFIWVRSRRIAVERNLILDCDRGVAFGNPGQSTANASSEPRVDVTDGVIRNNIIVGGADSGIELWHAEGVRVIHNSIRRPERNWPRGLRVGTGTTAAEIRNNLIHGEILLEGGVAQLRDNLTGRLEGYFADPIAGRLDLTRRAVGAIDQGELLPDAPVDIRGRTRIGKPDLGALEFQPAAPP